jgi:hypothetical protein
MNLCVPTLRCKLFVSLWPYPRLMFCKFYFVATNHILDRAGLALWSRDGRLFGCRPVQSRRNLRFGGVYYIALMMEAVSLPETSVSTRLHGATAQKSTRRRENVKSRLVVCFMKCMLTGVLVYRARQCFSLEDSARFADTTQQYKT